MNEFLTLRPAREADVPGLEELILLSVHGLQASTYSEVQREAALGPVFGVDRTLIADGTYWVVEAESRLVGCGGWSRRNTLFGGDESVAADPTFLDPANEPARVRAFFVHPDFARRGIGSAILRACEEAIVAAGFRAATMVATLAGVPLYTRCGYIAEDHYEIPLRDGVLLPVVRMGKRFAS